jgi:hypothetical protein
MYVLQYFICCSFDPMIWTVVQIICLFVNSITLYGMNFDVSFTGKYIPTPLLTGHQKHLFHIEIIRKKLLYLIPKEPLITLALLWKKIYYK